MENFVVSARKYRPVTFDSVVGQSHITTTLKNAIHTQHLAQAFLFCGPRGVGKTTCARILAKTINCENISDTVEACGTCNSCKSFSDNASFNIHELDAASNNGVENIRELIDQVRYPPTSGKYKIYIIDEVHMLTTGAFNAFLKTLEEPPAYAIFILATTEKHKILPTILSRCQIFDFNRIKVADMASHLAQIAQNESVTVEPEALELIAQKADGGLRDALSMFDLLVTFAAGQTLSYQQAIENLHILDYDYYFKITQNLAESNQVEAFVLLDQILKKGFDGHLFLVGLLEHFRNLLMSKNTATAALLEYSVQVQDCYKEQAKAISMSFLTSALSIGSQCDINYKASKNQRLLLEITLLKIANLGHLFNFNEVEKKNLNVAPSTVTIGYTPPTITENRPEQPNVSSTAIEVKAPEYLASSVLENNPPKKTVNLKSTKYPVAVEPKIETVAQNIEEETVNDEVNLAPLEMSQVQVQWDAFCEQLKQKNQFSELTWINRPFTLENQLIKLGLDSTLQESLLFENDVFTELKTFLRKNLKCPKLNVELFVLEKPLETNLVYTPNQRYNYLNTKNPNLAKLKVKLGLDHEF